MKTCSKCGVEKPVNEFQERPDTKDGLRSECKACISARNKARYYANAEQVKAKQREWNARNKDKKREAGRKWALENPDKVKASHKKWAANNPDKARAKIRRWAKNNPDKVREKSKRWREANPEKAKEVSRRGSRKIWDSPMGRLNGIISSAIRRTLKGAKSRRHWEELVGYSVDELRAHIEKQFDANMDWENQGSYWEIDHIIPIYAFNFQSTEHADFKRAWALKNLRPLARPENRRKSAKLAGPFQPSLAI